jgi:hypothetical protein
MLPACYAFKQKGRKAYKKARQKRSKARWDKRHSIVMDELRRIF